MRFIYCLFMITVLCCSAFSWPILILNYFTSFLVPFLSYSYHKFATGVFFSIDFVSFHCSNEQKAKVAKRIGAIAAPLVIAKKSHHLKKAVVGIGALKAITVAKIAKPALVLKSLHKPKIVPLPFPVPIVKSIRKSPTITLPFPLPLPLSVRPIVRIF